MSAVLQHPWAQRRVLALATSFETHKVEGTSSRTNALAGTQYASKTLAEVFKAEPTRQQKGMGPCVLAHDNIQHDGRSLEGASRGRFHFLWSDLDKGNPDPQELFECIDRFTGEAATLLYTTASSTPEDRRFRVILPLAEPVDHAAWCELQEALTLHLQQGGFQVDRSCERATQPVYLPNTPPGAAALETWGEEGPGLDHSTAPGALEALASVRATREADRIKAEAAFAAAAARKAAAKAERGDDAGDVAGTFNAAHDLADVMAEHGFVPKNHRGIDWRSPLSKSGSFGVRLYGTKAFSLHASDDEAGLGMSTNGGRVFDAFDLYVHFVHKGDFAAAVRAAAVELGISTSMQNTQSLSQLFAGIEAAATAGAASADDADSEMDSALLASKVPDIDTVAFYGPLAAIVETATANSEATRVGVALHLICSFAAYWCRPFYVELGDDNAGLNVFTVQVGQSALGRKGTSAAITDRRVMPGMLAHAARFAQEVAQAREASAADQQSRFRAEGEIERLKAERERVLSYTIEDIDRELDIQTDAEVEIEALEKREAFIKEKLANSEISPRGRKDYANELDEVQAALQFQHRRMEAADLARRQIGRAMNEPAVVLAELDAAIAVHEETLAQPARSAAVAPWVEVLADFASKPIVLSGVSSGEGLAWAIRDDAEGFDDEGNPTVEPGVPEKRMLLNLSELGSVLSLVRRPGSTLSTVIRNAYDAVPLETNSKTQPVTVAEHHIGMSASITPAELVGLMFDAKDSSASADNGLGNRPLYAFVRRTKLVSRPTRAEGCDEITETLWANVVRVYAALQPTGPHRSAHLEFSAEGAAAWDAIYSGLDSERGSSERAHKLHGRVTTNTRKLAAILAVMSGEHTVGPEAVRAAAAWAAYCSKTVDVVVSDFKDRVAFAKVKAHAERVWRFTRKLTEEGGGEYPTRRDVVRHSKLTSAEVSAAVSWLAGQSPALIEIDGSERNIKGRAVVRLRAKGEWR